MNGFIFNAPSRNGDTRKQALISQIMGYGAPAPNAPLMGATQGFNSILAGIGLRRQNMGPFPDMPGGGQPNFVQNLRNIFGRPGGLY